MLRKDLVEDLFNTIFQLRKLFSQKSYEDGEGKQATILQFSALCFLNGQSDITVSDLGNFLHLSKSSATQLTERLVTIGFIKRVSDKEDRRIIRLAITSKGKRELFSLKQKMVKNLSQVFAKISQNDLKELLRINKKLVSILESDNYEIK